MKTTHILVALLAFSLPKLAPAWFKFTPLKLPEPFPLSGQTVYVRFDTSKEAHVVSVSRSFMCDDIESLGFAIIAPLDLTPHQCLQRAKPIVRAAGFELTTFVPVVPQPKTDVVVPGGRVYWFKVVPTDDERRKLKKEGFESLGLEYVQELLDGHFYMMSEVVEDDKAKSAFDSSLAYQLVARSTRTLLRVPEKDADYERLADVVVVYLRFGKLVDIDAGVPRNG